MITKTGNQDQNQVYKASRNLRIGVFPLVSDLSKADHPRKWIDLDLMLKNNIKLDPLVRSCVIVLSDSYAAENKKNLWNWVQEQENADFRFIILSKKMIEKSNFSPIPFDLVHLILPINLDASVLKEVVEQTFEIISLGQEKSDLNSQLNLSNRDIRSLARIGKLIGLEHDFEKLIRLISFEFRKLVSADSGSIYIVERNPNNSEKPTHLRFKSTNLNLDVDEFLLPIDRSSIAGYVALTKTPLFIDDVYDLPENVEYSFNYTMDKKYNYRTKSMMVVPMKGNKNQLVGIIQLINRKINYSDRLTPKNTEGKVIPFNHRDLEFIGAMAGQAGVAIQNNFLLQDIRNLFEGFVTASVTAIEQRDITTSGHSFRVAKFTVELAKMVDLSRSKPFTDIRFSEDQIREIRYAGLLHDFGKVGVREDVLLKAKKLYPYQFEAVKWRYHLFRETIQRNYFENKLKMLEKPDRFGKEALKGLEQEKNKKLKELDEMFSFIVHSNEPSILAQGNFETLKQMTKYKIKLHTGERASLLEERDFLSLATRKGSLNESERREIESHVEHTYTFLTQIPWTQDLKFVPSIAHGHHEKLDGSGYPLGLSAPEISIQTRMMTIADVYDALTAPDRPYKASLPKEKALDIIRYEVEDNRIDPDLFDVFIEANVYDVCNTDP